MYPLRTGTTYGPKSNINALDNHPVAIAQLPMSLTLARLRDPPGETQRRISHRRFDNPNDAVASTHGTVLGRQGKAVGSSSNWPAALLSEVFANKPGRH